MHARHLAPLLVDQQANAATTQAGAAVTSAGAHVTTANTGKAAQASTAGVNQATAKHLGVGVDVKLTQSADFL